MLHESVIDRPSVGRFLRTMPHSKAEQTLLSMLGCLCSRCFRRQEDENCETVWIEQKPSWAKYA